LGGAAGADLTGIERRAARARNAVAAAEFAHRIDSADIRLPVAIGSQAAIVVLGANSDLQHLGVQVYTVFFVKIHGRLVHVFQPLDGCAKAGVGAVQILESFTAKSGKIYAAPLTVGAIIQKHSSAKQAAFPVNQQINNGRTAEDLVDV